MKLLTVIVNYKTADLTIDCLRSLADQISAVPDARVVITDNASNDGSPEKIATAIAQNHWTWAEVKPLETNGGFAFGNNRGIEPSLHSDRPQYIYLLNPDTLVLPGALKELVAFMDEHPEVGIAGNRVINPDGSVRNSTFRFPAPLSELESAIRLGFVTRLLRNSVVAEPPPEKPARVDWVSGASMIIRREVFEKIGLLDDKYFMYYEETDFCLRAAKAGQPTWYVPSSKIVHIVGQASGVTGTKKNAKRRPRYWFDSRHRFFRTHYGACKTLAADLMWAGGFSVHNILRTLRGKPRTDPPWLLYDFVRYSISSYFASLKLL